jgi:TBC domain-containing protein kinase-like protein
MHDFYLVQWFMTLFAHILPLNQVQQIWTYLFSEKVEFLFFITVAILMQLESTLLSLDLTQTLGLINNIAGMINIKKLVSDANRLLRFTPHSFIAGDFLINTGSLQQFEEMEALRVNEYFARRWWELEALDYREDKTLCLISLDDLVKIEKRLLLDLRDFKVYNVMHMKGSFHMVQPQPADHAIYIKFLQCY